MEFRPDLFAEVVRRLHHGDVQIELSKALSECVRRASEEEKSAELKLTLKLKPTGGGMFMITHVVDQKLPKEGAVPFPMWGTPEGNLVDQNPMQRDWTVEAVEEQKQQLVNVDEPAEANQPE